MMFDGGNLQYCSPEQFSEGKITENTDLFSCGVLIYELCGFCEKGILMKLKFGQFPRIKYHPQKYILELASMLMNENSKERKDP